MAAHNELGKWGESRAVEFLEGQGYTVVERDWHYWHYDIDIIARRGNQWLFVEVKTRRNNQFGRPYEAVDWKKLRRLQAATDSYIRRHRITAPWRFDIISITGTPDTGCTIQQIEDILNPYVR